MFVAYALILVKISRMNFEELLKMVGSENPVDVCFDSRQVKKGDCFVAVKGTKSDGHNFIEAVITAGAKYIVSQKPLNIQFAKIVIVPDTSIALGILTQARYGYPAKKLINLAVT